MDILSTSATVQQVGIAAHGQMSKAVSDDPHIILKPAEPLAAGWYRLELELETEAEARPQIYFDVGWGFSEVFSTRLKRRSNTRYATVLKLPYPTPLLRLDPIDGRGKFRVRALRARRLSGLRLATTLGWNGARLLLRNPSVFLRRLPEFWRAIRQPRFIQMRDRLATHNNTGSYRDWIEKYDFDPGRDTPALAQAVEEMKDPPLISVVMPVYNTPAKLLDAAIESVRNQIYPHWELCIADDCSPAPHVRQNLEKWQRRDKRIKVIYREENGHISHASNSALSLVEGEWVALLDHDDILREHALAEVALEIARNPQAQLIYSDEDKLDAHGTRYDPYFKPDFSRELFRSQNYLNHLTVHRAENIRAVGGWRPGFEGSQDYDLNLRIFERIDPAAIRHIPKVLYHWRAVEGSTAVAGSEKNYAYDAGMRALKDHVERTGLAATVEAAPDTPFYRIRMKVPDPAPLVSLIIPTRDKVNLLKGCVESIRAKTTYPNYEILVIDNGSEESETLAYFRELEQAPNVRVIAYDRPFNYSAINNFAVTQAKGEIVGLINNDIEVISPDWLTEMVSWAIQPDVGCVGAKLYYANKTIQHAGVIIGLGGVAGHSHKHFPRDHPGYFYRLKILQNLSAVTAACLIVRKQIYQEVGGLEETYLKVAFNDVDFCLNVQKAGYRNVWTPFAELFHLESISRGLEDTPEKRARFYQEILHMKRKWRTDIARDPSYSQNLTLDTEDFAIKG